MRISKRMGSVVEVVICPAASQEWVGRNEWRVLEVYNGPQNLRSPRRRVRGAPGVLQGSGNAPRPATPVCRVDKGEGFGVMGKGALSATLHRTRFPF